MITYQEQSQFDLLLKAIAAREFARGFQAGQGAAEVAVIWLRGTGGKRYTNEEFARMIEDRIAADKKMFGIEE